MTKKQFHILLADDDHDDRLFFGRALKEIPISTILSTVNDGQELMDLLNDENVALPDVVFLDINMPRKNGTECLAEIKHSARLKDLPVVMFSTTNFPEDIQMLFKKGANIYIHKPNDFTKLKEVIHHALPISSEINSSKTAVKYILNA